MSHAALVEWPAALWRASWQGGLAILVALAIGRLAPAVPPSLRCWLWRLVYLKLVISLVWTVPVALPVLPGEPVAAPVASAPARTSPPPARTPAPSLSPPGRAAPARGGPHPSPLHPGAVLLALWLAGVAVGAVRLGAQGRRVHALRRSGRRVEDAELLRLFAEGCRALRLRNAPPLLFSDAIERPMLAGFLRPVVLLPRLFLQGCGPGEQRLVLAHELAHVKRRDLHWEWLRIAARSLFFFHPLVWLADAEWRFAQELACDELTLAVTAASPSDYGRLLLRVSTTPARAPTKWGAAAASLGIGESFAGLRLRLRALGSLRRWSPAAAGAAGAALVMVALAGIVPWRAVSSTRVTYLDLGKVAEQPLEEGFVSSEGPGNNLAELPRGEQVFGGSRFRVGDRCIQLAGRLHPSPPLEAGPIPVGRRFSTLAILHGTGWGGQAPGKSSHVPDGTRIGEYRVRYRDGGVAVIPVVYGEDVRDWWFPGRREDPMPRGRLGWTGQNEATRHGALGIRLYVTSWKNPRPSAEVSHLEFATAGTACAPFCVAITCGD